MKIAAANLFKIGLGAFISFGPLFLDTASAAPKCSAVFSSPTGELSMEQINQAILELSALRFDIDKSQAQGTNSIARSALEQDFRKKLQLITQYIESSGVMTRAELAESIKNNIAKLQNRNSSEEFKREEEESRVQRQQQEDYALNSTNSTLHRVAPGTFNFFAGKKIYTEKKVTITHPYDLMAVLTTQFLWRKVVELSQQHYPGKYTLPTEPSRHKGDRLPVESVSRNMVDTWFKALNELSAAGEPTLSQLIAGHKKGSVYRLPTEAEWHYVLQERGTLNLRNIYEEGYGWFKGNSNDTTEEVGLKKPMVVDGHEFYDLIGNVSEFATDPVNTSGPQPKDIDLIESKDAITLGGNHRSSTEITTLTYNRSDRFSWLGFRIARTVEPTPVPLPKTIWQKLIQKLRRQ